MPRIAAAVLRLCKMQRPAISPLSLPLPANAAMQITATLLPPLPIVFIKPHYYQLFHATPATSRCYRHRSFAILRNAAAAAKIIIIQICRFFIFIPTRVILIFILAYRGHIAFHFMKPCLNSHDAGFMRHTILMMARWDEDVLQKIIGCWGPRCQRKYIICLKKRWVILLQYRESIFHYYH